MKHSSHFPLCGQKGFAIVTAIFILLMLASLAAFVASVSTTQHTTSAQDLQGSRAYQAARAGVEWGLYQVLDPTNSTVVVPGSPTWPNLPACPATKTWSIEGFSVEVECSRTWGGTTVYTEGGAHSIAVYRIRATASAGVVGSPGYIERQVQATVGKCRATDGVAPAYACS